MSEYTKPCTTCKKEKRMSNNSGKWIPLNLDNSLHRCFAKKEETATKKPLTIEDLDLRLRMVESIVLDPRK